MWHTDLSPRLTCEVLASTLIVIALRLSEIARVRSAHLGP
jgi:hypothetical protein